MSEAITRCRHGHRVGLPWVACAICKPKPDHPGYVIKPPPCRYRVPCANMEYDGWCDFCSSHLEECDQH